MVHFAPELRDTRAMRRPPPVKAPTWQRDAIKHSNGLTAFELPVAAPRTWWRQDAIRSKAAWFVSHDK